MPWFKVDDDLTFHRKVVKAGNAAMGLWVRAGAWSSQQLTDGFVPDAMIDLMGTPAQRRKLLAAQLWVEVDGGCMFYGWNKNGRQPSSQSVREKRADAARRQQKYRDELYRKSQVKDSRNAVTDTAVTDSVTKVFTPPPTRPDPSTPSEYYPPAADAPGQTAFMPAGPESQKQAAQRITKAFAETFKPCNFKAVLSIVTKSLDAGWSAAAVEAGIFAVGESNRPITLDTVRNEMRGGPRSSNRAKPSGTAAAIASADEAWDEFEARHGGNVHQLNFRSEGA